MSIYSSATSLPNSHLPTSLHPSITQTHDYIITPMPRRLRRQRGCEVDKPVSDGTERAVHDCGVVAQYAPSPTQGTR